MKNIIKKDRIWTVQPDAERLITELLSDAFSKCSEANFFCQNLLANTGIRFRDIVDHIVIPEDPKLASKFVIAGWEFIDSGNQYFLRNFNGFFPALLFGSKLTIAFKVEHVADFIKTMNHHLIAEGKEHSIYRRCKVWENDNVSFIAVERNGYDGFELQDVDDIIIRQSRIHLQGFRTRMRFFNSKEEGFDFTDTIVKAAVNDLGKDWACALFLKAEREYWQSRNYAGRLQKQRQDALGIGWANQDHHTYDNSREWFHRVIHILEMLGFECRELFYAGHQAGWGSQILEQPVLGSIIFADIDLAPDELTIDFAHEKMEPLHELRRAGLWTELHGESMLEAGLNHLECMFDHKALHEQFEELNIPIMKPFSDFPHLYQELTVGEWWPVNPDKVDELESKNLITKEQAEDFRLNGAIGSHFENLERNEGFKGFNQPGIDGVLRIIDPRKNLVNQ